MAVKTATSGVGRTAAPVLPRARWEVTAVIKQTLAAIGYIEYGYATHAGLPMAELEKLGQMLDRFRSEGLTVLGRVYSGKPDAGRRVWPRCRRPRCP